MNPTELKILNAALAKLALLKCREMTAPMLVAFANELSRYDLPAVLAAIDGAARTPGWVELASITSLIDGDPATDALLAWAGTGGDPAIAEAARRAVGLLDRGLLEADRKFLRKPFLDTYAAMASRERQFHGVAEHCRRLGLEPRSAGNTVRIDAVANQIISFPVDADPVRRWIDSGRIRGGTGARLGDHARTATDVAPEGRSATSGQGNAKSPNCDRGEG